MRRSGEILGNNAKTNFNPLNLDQGRVQILQPYFTIKHCQNLFFPNQRPLKLFQTYKMIIQMILLGTEY